MKCNKCNSENMENAKFCASCGNRLGENVEIREEVPRMVPVYNAGSAIAAIIVSILCCAGWLGLIFAILSLCDGNSVKTLVALGKYSEAQAKLESAQRWSRIAWIIIGISIVISLIVGVFYGILMAADIASLV